MNSNTALLQANTNNIAECVRGLTILKNMGSNGFFCADYTIIQRSLRWLGLEITGRAVRCLRLRCCKTPAIPVAISF